MILRRLVLVGGTLVLWCLCSAPALAQLSTLTDRGVFASDFPVHVREGFESLSPGTGAPFVVGGVEVRGFMSPQGPHVTATLVGLPHSVFFMGFGSPENFLLANNSGFDFTWPGPVNAIGFDLQCFACDNEGSPSSIQFDAFDASGGYIGSAVQVVFLNATVRFAGVRSTAPFHKLRVSRVHPSGFANWMIDDLRFATDQLFASGFE